MSKFKDLSIDLTNEKQPKAKLLHIATRKNHVLKSLIKLITKIKQMGKTEPSDLTYPEWIIVIIWIIIIILCIVF